MSKQSIRLINASVVSALNNKADIELENSTRASEIASLANSAHTAATAAQTTADAANTLINTSLTEMNNKIANIKGNIPTGFIVPFAANTAPEGFLLCNGASISKTTYKDLYDIIGTIYGSVDVSHFSLPNLTDGRYLQGSTTSGVNISEGLPEIFGSFGHTRTHDNPTTEGAFYNGPLGTMSAGQAAGTLVEGTKVFKASLSNPIYNNSENVTPKSLSVVYYIKY